MPRKNEKEWYWKNVEKCRARVRDYYRRNSEIIKEKARADKLKKKYGLTKEDIPNICDICSSDGNGKICVDHCHKTGQVRGFLCTQCNFLIGLAKDDPKILQKAKKYLTNAAKKQIIDS